MDGTRLPKDLRRARRAVAQDRRARRRVSRAERLVAACAKLLGDQQQRNLVLLTAPGGEADIQPWLTWRPAGYRMLVLGLSLPAEAGVMSSEDVSVTATEEAIRRFGAAHLIVDLRSTDLSGYERTWAALRYHLVKKGLFVMPRARGNGAEERAVADWLTGLRPKPDGVAKVSKRPSCYIIRKKGQHLLGIADDAVEGLLGQREPAASVERVLERPPGSLRSRAPLTQHPSSHPMDRFPETMPYPPMRLRRYSGDLKFAGRTLVYTGHSIIPESFRHYRSAPLFHPRTHTVGEGFHKRQRMPSAAGPVERLTGEHLLLDPQYQRHFGHTMTEVVSRLWAWDDTVSAAPGVKALYAVPKGRDDDPLLRRLLMAYGIPEDRLAPARTPVEIESLWVPSTMWHNRPPQFVHPDIVDVWRRVARGLGVADVDARDRIFISRGGSTKNRRCNNILDVERFFADRGFEIIYPEQHDLAVQAGIFRSAPIIAGFAGSAMCNLMFAENIEHLLLVTHEDYPSRNEYLYASVLGPDVHYFWSTPDFTYGNRPDRAKSAWTFDFERNAPQLDEVLRNM